jgi:PKD repeat protein
VFNKNLNNVLNELEGGYNPHIWNVKVNNYYTKLTAVINSATDFGKNYEDTEIRFYGENSTDSESELSYYWQFGDGSTSEETNPTHVYQHPDTYSVTLKVTDHDDRTDTATLVLTVVRSVPTANVAKPTKLHIKVGTPIIFESDVD